MKSWFDREMCLKHGMQKGGKRYREFLSMAGEETGDSDAQIMQFLEELGQLQGVSPDFLAADSSMLPMESLRFFSVDENWVDCLVDGALSTGGEEVLDWGREIRKDVQRGARTGFLLRSVLVKAFPGIVATAKKGDEELEIERLSYMGEDVLLGIVKGEMDSLAFMEPEEGILCEFSYNEQGVLCAGKEEVKFRNESVSGVIDFKQLAEDMEKDGSEFSAAELGRLLLCDGEGYSFSLKEGE